LLQQLVRDRPELSRPQINLGQILHLQGRLADARAVLRKAIEHFGDEPLACFTLARIEQDLGQSETAIEYYRRACRAKPDYVEASYELGSLLVESGDVAGAIEPLRRAVSAEPAFVPGHLKLSQALRVLGQEDEAAKHADIAEKLNGSVKSRGPASAPGAGSDRRRKRFSGLVISPETELS
jgi:tetratricopeptide (TPR) repeat protein